MALTRTHRARALVVVLVATIVAACSTGTTVSSPNGSAPDGSTPAAPPVRGGSLVVGTAGEVDGMNPLSSQWSGAAYQMGRAVLDPLVVMDAEGQWQPYLAKSITPNADFTAWTFQVRPGITFHNGEALDAAALALFFDMAVNSPLSSQGFPEKPTITTAGDTVTLTFTKPWSAMPSALTEQTGYVIAPAQLKSGDAKQPIGTGPFVYEEWVPGDHFRATRNPDYWRDGLPYLDSIEFRPIPDITARFNALQAGDLDAAEANSTGTPRLDELAAAGFTVIDDYDNVGVTNLLMNTQRAPTDDSDVRAAIVAGIDREAFRDAVLDPSFEVADQPYPPGNPWHTDIDYPDHDADRARQLVDDYEADNGPIEISIMTIATPNAGVASQFLQQELASIGIDAAVESLELSAYVKRFISGDYDTVYLGAFFGATDPDGSYPFIWEGGASPDALIKLNFARYVNPVVDESLAAQRATDDRAARKQEWTTIWQAFADDNPYAFLAYDRTAWVTKPDVAGLEAPTTPEGAVLPAINRWTPFYTSVHRTADDGS